MTFDECDAMVLAILAEEGDLTIPALAKKLEQKSGFKLRDVTVAGSLDYLEEFDFITSNIDEALRRGRSNEMFFSITGTGHQERINMATRPPRPTDRHIPGTEPKCLPH